MPLELNRIAGDVYARLIVLNDHTGVSSVDAFEGRGYDPDGTGERLKEPGASEGSWVRLGAVDDLEGKILEWVWMVSRPPRSTQACAVRICVAQATSALAAALVPTTRLALDRTVSAGFPVGKSQETFSIFFRVAVDESSAKTQRRLITRDSRRVRNPARALLRLDRQRREPFLERIERGAIDESSPHLERLQGAELREER